MDIFRKSEDDESCLVSREDFRHAVSTLGLDFPEKDVDELFDSWDSAGSGQLELKEVDRILRQQSVLEAELQADGRDKIQDGSGASIVERPGVIPAQGNKVPLRKGLLKQVLEIFISANSREHMPFICMISVEKLLSEAMRIQSCHA